jgi:hypothetical protein
MGASLCLASNHASEDSRPCICVRHVPTIEVRHRLALFLWRTQGEQVQDTPLDEGRKRVIGIMAAILASLHMRTADDLF